MNEYDTCYTYQSKDQYSSSIGQQNIQINIFTKNSSNNKRPRSTHESVSTINIDTSKRYKRECEYSQSGVIIV